MLDFLSVMFAIELGMVLNSAATVEGIPIYHIGVEEKANRVSMDFEVQADIAPLEVFAGGGMSSIQQYAWNGSFFPLLQRYSFNAGIRIDWFEIGFRHMCEHPVTIYNMKLAAPLDLHERGLYVRAEFEF